MYRLSEVLWKLTRVIRGIDCFFTGHDERSGNRLNYENDWCEKCFVAWPQDKITLPRLLTRVLGWVVDREWRWFYRFDFWIEKKLGPDLPDWWEY